VKEVRQNADATMTFLRKTDIKKVYFVWWGIYLAVSFGFNRLRCFYTPPII